MESIDALADHLREHCRGHYERVEAAHVEATVEGMREAMDPLPGATVQIDHKTLGQLQAEALLWRRMWRARTEGMARRW